MKHLKIFLLGSTFFTSALGFSQDLIVAKTGELMKLNSSIHELKKYSDNTFKTNPFDRTKTYYIDKIVNDIKLIDSSLDVSNDYDFMRGIQNPHNTNIWVYLERQQIGGNFKLIAFDKSNNTKKIIQEVNNNSQRNIRAYKPIGWSNDANILFLEGIYLDSAEEHEGVWILNLQNNQFSKIANINNYLSTPVLSPSRDKFYATSNVDNQLDFLHGENNKLVEYNISNQTSKILLASKGDNIVINGFEGKFNDNLVTQATSFSNLDYYLPWDFGKTNVVSRHGTPGPVGDHVFTSKCGCFSGGQHGYAAVDFATSQSSDDNVRAAQDGVVSFAGISGSLTSGYGRLVIIRHSDGTRTYYAHNKTILVSEGQTVTKGKILALEGTTGGSTGDHIHFEWRANGSDASVKGSFTGIGEPRQDYYYRSNNSETVLNTPTTTSPANNATGVVRPVNITWTTPVNATSFRLQVSKSSTGWTETDGFTSATTPSSTVVVNASLNNVLNFFWQDDNAAGTFEGPKPNTTYFYTVRSFDATTGTSKYSAVKKFTTDEGVILTSPAFGANVSAPVALAWTSSIGSSGSYRLQIAKSSSGWTAANGFSTTTGNIVVNHSAAGLLNYSWNSGSAGSTSAPVAGTVYYWTVRLFNPANNFTSSYSPVRAFKVSTAAARILNQSIFDNESIVAFPNPVSESLNIVIKDNKEQCRIEIINFDGAIVKYLDTKEESNLINVSDIKKGMYFLRVYNGKVSKISNIIIGK